MSSSITGLKTTNHTEMFFFILIGRWCGWCVGGGGNRRNMVGGGQCYVPYILLSFNTIKNLSQIESLGFFFHRGEQQFNEVFIPSPNHPHDRNSACCTAMVFFFWGNGISPRISPKNDLGEIFFHISPDRFPQDFHLSASFP